MYVNKRNGGTETVSFDKIMRRVRKCGNVLIASAKRAKELAAAVAPVGGGGVDSGDEAAAAGGGAGSRVAEIRRGNKERSGSFDGPAVVATAATPREPLLKINYAALSMKIIEQLYDNIPTVKIDELTAEQCASMSSIHLDYNTLAGRIIVSSHHKATSDRFSVVASQLYNCKDRAGEATPLVSKELHTIVKKYSKELNELCDYSRDYLIDYFGFKTLERSYLMRIDGRVVERPQHMWLRVAIGIHGDNMEKIRETYEFMSQKYFIHATPTLFNAGTPHPQCSSCFLLSMEEDSIDGIFNTLKSCAQISKYSGGIGLTCGKIRANGSKIRNANSKSSGIVPMLRVFNNTARYVNQGGKRNGSFAIYLEPWHADVEDFLEMRKNHGEEDMKARDLFYALWIPDLFMRRVHANEPWTLFCPNEAKGLADVHSEAFDELYNKYESLNLGRKVVNARELWYKILDAQMETGTPYLLYKDACNAKSNQQNLGTIQSSNLCVAPETQILTDNGYIEIQKLCGQKVNVWNGKEFSNVEIFKTGENQKLIEVHTSDGCVLHCTPYHKFYIQQQYARSPVEIIEAQHLKPSNKIVKCDYPIIDGKKTMNYTYTHGFFCGDGTYYNNIKGRSETKCKFKCLDNHYYCKRHINYETENNIDDLHNDTNIDKIKCNAFSYSKKPEIYLYDEKKKLVDCFDHISCKENSGRTVLRLPLDIQEKFFVPIDHSLETKMQWFSGYCDADGSIANNKTNQQLQVSSINKDFLTNIKFMLQTCGINPKISNMHNRETSYLPDGKGGHRDFNIKPIYRLLITSVDLVKLIDLGFSPKRLVLNIENKPDRAASQFIKISQICDNGRYDDTYCFTEPNKHAGIFNGVYTSQCSEIVEYSDANETAVCNLASIALPSFVEYTSEGAPFVNFEKLHKVARIVTYNLNRVIDVNFYPTEKCKTSNFRHRPIGAGVQGLFDLFMLMDYPFSSPEAKQLNKDIFETIYHGALTESIELAKQFGPYETYEGSPISKGLLQFDLWGSEISAEVMSSTRYDWALLKEEIKEHKVRHSLLIALMPTASTSQILGNVESFEVINSNIFSRSTLAGEFVVVNKYLMQDLQKLGIWNESLKNSIIQNNGSVQHLNSLSPHLKEKYKTAWETSMRTFIDLSADRAPFICQSQSLNLWMENPSYEKMTAMHFYAWNKGLKTGQYYFRRRSTAKTQQFTIEPEKNNTNKMVEEDEEVECLMCSA